MIRNTTEHVLVKVMCISSVVFLISQWPLILPLMHACMQFLVCSCYMKKTEWNFSSQLLIEHSLYFQYCIFIISVTAPLYCVRVSAVCMCTVSLVLCSYDCFSCKAMASGRLYQYMLDFFFPQFLCHSHWHMIKLRITVLLTCLRLCGRLAVVAVAYRGMTSLISVCLETILSSQWFQQPISC